MSGPRSTPPRIGSPQWDRELATIGVDRKVLDDELAVAIRDSESIAGEVDPHSLDFSGEPAQVAAAWILFHQHHPSYGALMYLGHVWSSAEQTLRDWVVRQFAAMLVHGPGPVAASGEYGLWVDYFEAWSEAPGVFTSLAAQTPHSCWHRLLSAAGPVPWTAKRDYFLEAAEIPELHTALAEGISGSFYDIYGNVDAVEAAHLLDRITVADDDLRDALVEATTQPLRLRSGSVIVVDDPTWRYPGSLLVHATVSGGRWRWVPGSELVADGTVYGRLVHRGFTLDGRLSHQVFQGRPLDGHHRLHRVEAVPEHAEALVDRELEAWPPGLREYVARTRGRPAEE
ncbi:hypothetical protein I0C86_09510 [Plantactinospora sp. S1510]|uniref:Uncharacterized protein n=1 Tax=Plantactinospora alkalitolerans TaxID=2789879 RepID=A0ABS0GSP6_9ACTN|nr:hypothetical protein [Plantactinospora alkalitolerans]MBF9129210.1 hypothetical protein [Plantactinospora alkalitolerans]